MVVTWLFNGVEVESAGCTSQDGVALSHHSDFSQTVKVKIDFWYNYYSVPMVNPNHGPRAIPRTIIGGCIFIYSCSHTMKTKDIFGNKRN